MLKVKCATVAGDAAHRDLAALIEQNTNALVDGIDGEVVDVKVSPALDLGGFGKAVVVVTYKSDAKKDERKDEKKKGH